MDKKTCKDMYGNWGGSDQLMIGERSHIVIRMEWRVCLNAIRPRKHWVMTVSRCMVTPGEQNT